MIPSRYNFLILLLLTSILSAQKDRPFGKLTLAEKNLTTYDKDPEANAVVLYESGSVEFKVTSTRIVLKKDYHVKIKILNEKGFSQANISIPFYHSDKATEEIRNLKALTHNGDTKAWVLDKQVHEVDLNDRWSEQRFTFPKIQKGSIIEYKYSLYSPFLFNLKGWDFQSDLPKIYSEYNASIPGNYRYNRSLTGFLKLSTNDAKIRKSCFSVPGSSRSADCEVLKYAMKDIPAFKEEEEFMLSPRNYISRINFELSEYHRFDGTVDKYTKSWKDVDKEFRTDQDIGRQLTKKGFFEKNVPENLLTEGDDITRAKSIYNFIQDRFTWNGEFGIYRNIRVKDAFNERSGNIGEINISMINLLNAADIPTRMVLLSTRNHGLPKKLHPVMSDFNYIIAKATINGEDYLLDASDKLNPFGMLPFHCLNYYGRVMDFKKESSWLDIIPESKNRHQVRAFVDFDMENGRIKGIFDEINLGYDAVYRRKALKDADNEAYLTAKEEEIGPDFEIVNYTFYEERSDDKKVSERFEFELNKFMQQDRLYLNPFFVRFFKQNPFRLQGRRYPIDFGFKRNYSYQVSIAIPEGYEVIETPEKKALALEENGGKLVLNHQLSSTQIMLSFELSLNQTYFEAPQYPLLKELFKQAVDIQSNSIFVLKKKSAGSDN